MVESLFIGLTCSLFIYVFLCVSDVIMEYVMQKIEKYTKKPLEDYFLPWYDEEP